MERNPQHFHERVIHKNRNEIQRKIDPIAVLDHMGDTLSDPDRQRIIQRCRNEGHIAGASELMEVLLRAYPESFVRFVEAVVKAGSGDSGRVLAKKLCRCVPSRFKAKISHIFPEIQGECVECSNDDALVPHGVEGQPSRTDQCSLGRVAIKGFSPDGFPAQQGNSVTGNMSFHFMSEKRGIEFQAQVHCAFIVPGKSTDSEETVAQLATGQEEDKSCHVQQEEERSGSDKGKPETSLCMAERSCRSRGQRLAAPITTPSFFAVVMESSKHSLATRLVNTPVRDVDAADEKLSNERLTVPSATIGMHQGFQPGQHCPQRKNLSGPGRKPEQEKLCIKSIDDALRTSQESDAVAKYCYSIDPQLHFTKKLHTEWLAAIQTATDTVLCECLKQSEDLEEALNKSVEGRDE